MIESVTNIVIAVLGLLIAIIQIISEMREKRKDKKEEKKMNDEKNILIRLAKTNTELLSTIDEFNNFYKAVEIVNTPEADATEKLQIYINAVAGCINKYVDFINQVYVIYRIMLRNEERFSMSYGFGRYIDAYRGFLQSRDIVRYAHSSYDELCEFIKGYNANPDPIGLAEHCDKVLQYMNRLKDALMFIVPYAEELNLKYSEDDADDSEYTYLS